jgi:DNA mismatch endonuclease Vsr
MQISPQRSYIMRSVKSKNTGVELLVRGVIRSLGFPGYRLNVKTLIGKPDIVFRKRKKIIFVHGCFWHGHNCGKGNLPKSNVPFWEDKINRNKTLRGVGRDRTGDTRIFSPLLYRLSYRTFAKASVRGAHLILFINAFRASPAVACS